MMGMTARCVAEPVQVDPAPAATALIGDGLDGREDASVLCCSGINPFIMSLLIPGLLGRPVAVVLAGEPRRSASGDHAVKPV